MNKAEPGAISKYTLSFQYNTETDIGSVDMLFCVSPIPDDPCRAPDGLDLTNVTLSDQAGEVGYSLQVISTNHMILKRPVSMPVSAVQSMYVFENVRNPTNTQRPFAIRLADYASTDASGPVVDLGSVIGSVGEGVMLYAQVPPMLLFCVAQKVTEDCAIEEGGNYTDMGTLSADSPITAQSQMAVGTNASAGFAITVNGTSMVAGNSVIDPLAVPTVSLPGTNQFGINLVANNEPTVGSDPDGEFTNAIAAPKYGQVNKYAYKDGDLVAMSPNVSLVRRYTVSYVVNIKPTLPSGVYSTTLTYICSGRF